MKVNLYPPKIIYTIRRIEEKGEPLRNMHLYPRQCTVVKSTGQSSQHLRFLLARLTTECLDLCDATDRLAQLGTTEYSQPRYGAESHRSQVPTVLIVYMHISKRINQCLIEALSTVQYCLCDQF